MANTVDTLALEIAMQNAPKQLFATLRPAFSKILLEFKRHHGLRRMSSQYTPDTRSSSALNVRSGTLRRSFQVIVTGSSIKDLSGAYGTNVVYAGIHEFGGTIRPRRRKYLTIPLDDALKPSGVLSKPARAWSPTFFTKSKRRADDLVMWWGKGASARPIFLLTKKPVLIEPRLGLREEWETFQPKVIKRLNEAVQEALNNL